MYIFFMNNYEILGLPINATLNDIKKKYRKLALEYHPDKTNGDTEKTKKFISIKTAYDELLLGITGETYNKEPNKNFKDGTFIVHSITLRDNKEYLVHVTVTNVSHIIIVGKYLSELGRYTINNQYFDGNLTLSKEDLLKLNYKVTLKFIGYNGNTATKSYKIKKPNYSFFSNIKLSNILLLIFILYICFKLIT